MAALLLVHSKFDFKSKYDQVKTMVSKGRGIGEMGGTDISGGRKRRDDNSEGYGKQYASTGGDVKNSTFLASVVSRMAPLIASTEMKESIGSPLMFAGLSIGLLLIVILLSFVEYLLIKRAGGDVAKYESVTLT